MRDKVIRLMVLAGLLVTAGCDFFVDASTRIARAEKQIAAADYRTAMIELREALQDEPNNAHARLLLAKVALQLGDPAGADEELQRARSLGTPQAETADLAAHIRMAMNDFGKLLAEIDAGKIELTEPARSIYRGQALHGLQREEEAIAAYQAALTANPQSDEARTGLAEALAAQGQFEQALKELDEVTARNAAFAPAWLVRGIVLARRGQFLPAEQALQTALDRSAAQLNLQQRAGLLASLTQAKLARGDIDGAQLVQQQLSKVSPDAVLTRFMAARIAIARQDYSTATNELHRLLNTAPDFLPARFLLGGALSAQGSLEQAEQQLAQVVRESPGNVEARKLLAQVRLQLERPEAAMQILVPALEAEKPDPQLRLLMSAAQAQLGDDSSAVSFLERSVDTHPDNDDLKLSLAAAYLKNNQRDKAVEVLSRTKGQSRLALARLMLQDKQPRKADEIIAQVIASAPDRTDITNLVGLLYLEAGRYDQALSYLRSAADRQPDNPGYWLNVARAQLALNQPAAAREAIDKALALRGDWTPAAALAAMLDLGAGHADAALARIVALKEKHPRDPQILMLEGEIRTATKQYSEAAAAFEAASRLRPTSLAALKEFSARKQAGEQDAAAPLRRWLLKEPDDLAVRFALAEAYGPKDSAKAIDEYQRILQRSPRNPVVLNNLAWLYHTTGDARAMDTARKAHDAAPRSMAIADTYGWILLQRGRTTEALPLLKEAAAKTDSPEIDAHYAEALKRSQAAAPAPSSR